MIALIAAIGAFTAALTATAMLCMFGTAQIQAERAERRAAIENGE